MKTVTAVLLSAMMISGAAFAKGKKHGKKPQSAPISSEVKADEKK